MRRRNLIFIAVSCVFFLFAGCHRRVQMATEPAALEGVAEKKGEPKIEFESLIHDFGKNGPRKKLLGEFKFTNTGDAPLKITKVERCCGVVTTLDKTDYEPGESGVLKVRYTSGRLPNKIKKRLYVNSNDKENPRMTLTIQAETVLKVTYEPKSMKLLLKDLDAGCPPITIKSVDNKPFSITGFQATGECLTADFDSSVEATQFVITPKPNMEKLSKSSTGRISINLAYSEPDVPPESITIIFSALSRFSFRPSNLVFIYSEPNEPIKKSLWVLNNYGEDFEIESIVSKDGNVKVLDQKKVGQRYQFELQITPTQPADGRTFTDMLYVKIKDGPEKTVVCRGILRNKKKSK